MKTDDKITIVYNGKPRAAVFMAMAPSRLLANGAGRFKCRIWHPPGMFSADAGDEIHLYLNDEGTLWVPGWGEEPSAELRAGWTMRAL